VVLREGDCSGALVLEGVWQDHLDAKPTAGRGAEIPRRGARQKACRPLRMSHSSCRGKNVAITFTHGWTTRCLPADPPTSRRFQAPLVALKKAISCPSPAPDHKISNANKKGRSSGSHMSRPLQTGQESRSPKMKVFLLLVFKGLRRKQSPLRTAPWESLDKKRPPARGSNSKQRKYSRYANHGIRLQRTNIFPHVQKAEATVYFASPKAAKVLPPDGSQLRCAERRFSTGKNRPANRSEREGF